MTETSVFDILNAFFVFGAATIKLRDIHHVLRDKQVSGVSRWPRLYATIWALYSIVLFIYIDFYFAATTFLYLAVVEFTYFLLLHRYRETR